MAHLPMSCMAANSKKLFSKHFKGAFRATQIVGIKPAIGLPTVFNISHDTLYTMVGVVCCDGCAMVGLSQVHYDEYTCSQSCKEDKTTIL